jgi:hypothetical protein
MHNTGRTGHLIPLRVGARSRIRAAPSPPSVTRELWIRKGLPDSAFAFVSQRNTSSALLAICSPHSCTKCPPSGNSIGGGQLRICSRKYFIAGAPNTGSFMPTAINDCPFHSVFHQRRARRDSSAPSASGLSGTILGKRRTPALYRISGNGAV